jgi:ribonuclease-3
MEQALEQVLAEALDRDARSALQEWSQAHYGLTPAYRIVGESGPEHEKEFTFEALIGDQVVGVGVGRSKQAAAHAAARSALQELMAGKVEVIPPAG